MGWPPVAVWREAAADPDAGTREEVAYAFDAPADVLASLAHDPDPSVVAIDGPDGVLARDAAGNPALTVAMMERIAVHA